MYQCYSLRFPWLPAPAGTVNRRKILLLIVLILIPVIVLYLLSVRTQNDSLLLLGVVIGAVLAGLAAFKDILELVDRLTGRSPFQPSIDPPSVTTNVQQTGRDSYGPIQTQHATITQTFNLPLSPAPPLTPSPLPLERPARATHFTGREAEVAQLLDELQPGRVVTLTGPGGRGRLQGKREKRERGGS